MTPSGWPSYYFNATRGTSYIWPVGGERCRRGIVIKFSRRRKNVHNTYRHNVAEGPHFSKEGLRTSQSLVPNNNNNHEKT